MATERSDYDVYVIADSNIADRSIADGEPAWAKNRRDGRPDEAHLDAAESLPYLLTTVFALYGRVRPYNEYLGWELRQHPLADPAWDADRLLPRLRRVLADGDPGTQRDLFGDLAVAARSAGLGHVLDGWGRELVLLT